jgi:Flp pilus assembly pilin Flp
MHFMKINKHIRHNKRGAALVEYGLIVAGVALVAAAAVSIFGSKTAGLVAASARVLPGANSVDNGVIDVGHIITVEGDGAGNVRLKNDNSTLNEDVNQKLGLDDATLVNDPHQ